MSNTLNKARVWFGGLFALAGLLLVPHIARAGHALGGEIVYTHLGNNQFEITVIFYRDCNPPNNLNGNNLDQSIMLGIGH